MGIDDTTLPSTLAVEEFSVSQVAVLAVEQGLMIQLSMGAAMDEFVKSNCLCNYYVFL